MHFVQAHFVPAFSTWLDVANMRLIKRIEKSFEVDQCLSSQVIVILILKDDYVGGDVEDVDDGNQKDREVFQSELAGKSLTVTLHEIQDGLINLRNP